VLTLEEPRVTLLLEQLDVHCHENEWFVSADTALLGTTAVEAAWVPPGMNNTIWQIVNHLLFWNEDVVHRLRGTVNPNKAADNDVTFGQPGDPFDEAGWEQTLVRFRSVMKELRSTIADVEDGQLDMPYRPDSPSIQRLLSNIMMHDTYHIGQIVLLRKLRSSWPGFDWS
jgi:uncharacterized damage-inducible protein DinB